jgi:hypothetical protein
LAIYGKWYRSLIMLILRILLRVLVVHCRPRIIRLLRIPLLLSMILLIPIRISHAY